MALIGHPRAIGSLMRFVFDRRNKVEDRDARGLAMRAIMELAEPEHAPRLIDFLLDIQSDEDAFVRGYAVEALGKFGDRRALPILRSAAQDPEEFVRERASRALRELEASAQSRDVLAQDNLSSHDLLGRIRRSQRGEREYYMGLLKSRPDAFELAVRLVQEGDLGTLLGLQLLQQIGDPRARDVARQHFASTINGGEQALCLRIVSQYMQSDMNTAELPMIEAGFLHPELLVRIAALDAAGASGHEPLMSRAIRTLSARDPYEVVTAAAALERGLTASHRRMLPELREAWTKLRARRTSERDALDLVQAEAHVLGAIGKLVDARTPGVSSVQRDALMALTDAHDRRPILVAALRLLRDTTPEDGLLEEHRWAQLEAASLIPLVDHADPRVRARALDLLLRAGPPAMLELGPKLEALALDDSIDAVRVLIPLASRTGGERCRRLLEDLSRSPDEAVREAAQEGLRLLRATQPFIDARFTQK
jgi:HEAT repeat protein